MKPVRRDRSRRPIKSLAVASRRPPDGPKQGWRVPVIKRWRRKAKSV